MTYSAVFENGVLLGFDGNTEPFLSQPTWPDGTAWVNETEALAWFNVLVTSFTDPTAPMAGNNPAEHPVERPVN